MSSKVSILIADANRYFAEGLCRHFASCDDMTVAGCVSDGKDIVPKLIECDADILIMDIVLPGKDGLTVISEIIASDLPKPPKIFIVTNMFSESTVRQASILEVAGFIAKPVDPFCLANRIRTSYKIEAAMPDMPVMTAADHSLFEPRGDDYLLHSLSDIIQRVGIPSHLSGNRYAREAAIMVYNDAKASDDMSAIYKTISNMFGTNPAAVERSIRNAVDYMWDKSATSYAERLFDRTLGKPRNTELITKLAHELRNKIPKH